MNWINTIKDHYQQTEPGTAKAHHLYYIYRVKAGEWRAGRHWFGRDVDFRLTFSSAKVARDYIALYDEEKATLIITAI